MTRTERLLPHGIPRYTRCYDDPKTADRYTVVFTGRYTHLTGGEFLYLGMSEHPAHPQGIGMHGSSKTQIDRPKYAHLGKRIAFAELPEDCKRVVISDYCELWDIETEATK